MKNRLIVFLAFIVCLIPTAIAYSSYVNTQKSPVDAANAVMITIEDTNGKTVTLNKKSEGDEADSLIKYFKDLESKSIPITSLPESLDGKKYFTVTLASSLKSEVYQCYFSPDPSMNYIKTPAGSTYKLNAADAEQFITSRYAESIYGSSTVPTLTIANTSDVTPDSATWKYKNYTGTYVDSDTSSITNSEIEAYSIEGSLDLVYDIAPDYCTVTVKNAAGDVVFDDILDNIGLLTVTKAQDFSANIIAKWFEDPSRTFCGELDYSFNLHVLAPAEFYLGQTSVKSGRFTAITAVNVTKPGDITVESNMPGLIQPTFYYIGNNTAVALLPIDLDVQTGSYTLTFRYGSAIQNTLIPITNDGFRASYYTVPENIIASARSESALAAFDAKVAELTATSASEIYFNGSFLEGIDGACLLRRGYGRDVYLNDATTAAYRNNGVDYTADAGVSVVAVNNGVVAFVGELEHTGKIVVVDHGVGLKTWYYNLGGTTVSTGDRVNKGDQLGTTGSTGFTAESGAHIAMSVGSQFVCPYDTWADSQIAAKVILAKIDE